MKSLFSFFRDRSGQALTEYALILAVIAVAVVTIMVTLGDKIEGDFEDIITALGG